MRAVASLALLVLLAGCMGSGPALRPPELDGAGLGGPPQNSVGLEVLEAREEPGRCFDGSDRFGEACHVLRVRIDNGENDFTVRTELVWSAADAAGGGATDGDYEGPASVAAGGATDATVRFTLRDGAPPLVRVVFDGHPFVRAEADIPVYA